jgi:hypothetical protein
MLILASIAGPVVYSYQFEERYENLMSVIPLSMIGLAAGVISLILIRAYWIRKERSHNSNQDEGSELVRAAPMIILLPFCFGVLAAGIVTVVSIW